MSLKLTTTYENGYFQRSIRPFCETLPFSHTTSHSDCIAGCGVLTVHRLRHITSPSWRPASVDTIIGQNGL
jgi:hypothetical protein